MTRAKLNRTIGLVALLCAHGIILLGSAQQTVRFSFDWWELVLLSTISTQAGLLGLLCGATRGRVIPKVIIFLLSTAILPMLLHSFFDPNSGDYLFCSHSLLSLGSGILIRRTRGRIGWLNKEQRSSLNPPVRFTLSQMMTATLLFAIIFGIGRWQYLHPSMPDDFIDANDLMFITFGCCMSIAVLIAAWAMLTSRRFLWRIPVAVLTIAPLELAVEVSFWGISEGIDVFAYWGAIQAAILLGTLFVLRMLGYRIIPPALDAEISQQSAATIDPFKREPEFQQDDSP